MNRVTLQVNAFSRRVIVNTSYFLNDGQDIMAGQGLSPRTRSIEPAILYLGTPVVLNSTVNENGSYNLAPISSAFWLGWRCMLGFEAVSKTPQNIIRTGECVINLPSVDLVEAIKPALDEDGL
jgi:flavin reductase (DIM6/NTAB) family NADH-FMN oxidoreductase RutF